MTGLLFFIAGLGSGAATVILLAAVLGGGQKEMDCCQDGV